MARAIIVGATGQDGTLLTTLLEKKNYSILGLGSTKALSRNMPHKPDPIDISDFVAVENLIKTIQPDEIYHLAAVHHSSQDEIEDLPRLFAKSYRVNVLTLHNFLEAIRRFSPKTKLFYAASSHIFGNPQSEPQDENTPMNPMNIYGITKASGVSLCRMYRNCHNVFASVGIFYNHESWLRGEQFVSQKIIRGALRCRDTPGYRLVLGNLSAEVDWGFAPDYVDAMQRILALDEPDDFVVATGEKHTVKEFVRIAFAEAGLNWQDYVDEKKDIITKDVRSLIGNPQKLKQRTGWTPSVSFPEMIKLIMKNS